MKRILSDDLIRRLEIESHKDATRAETRKAVRDKLITKLPCVECGNIISEGHHIDYDDPLNVVWLCRKHHMLRHKSDDRSRYRNKEHKQSMTYSIKPVIHNYAGKDGLSKVSLQVIFRRMKVYVPTSIKVSADHFVDGFIVKHKNKGPYNDALSSKKNAIEKSILEAIRLDAIKNKNDFERVVKSQEVTNEHPIFEYIIKLVEKLKGKLSAGRLKHYKVMANKIEEYSPNATFGIVTVQWLNGFETWLRNNGLDGNTVLSNMSLLLAILNKAHAESMIDEKQYKLYKRPSYNQKLVEYLTETELLKIKAAIDVTDKQAHKRAGYYFLLSAFTGYRISDTKRFNYDEMVKDNHIILRATKNKQIVSIPLYPQLREIIDFVKDHPLDLSEDKTRQYVKEICTFIGIKKDVKFHAARHSFAMFLISKGFSIDEIAILLGDSIDVAKVYARISNQHLKTKFNERLG